jgi:hypothetical protein
MKSFDTAESILSLYDHKLPFSVAEYFCFAFRKLIVCNKSLNYKLFKDFIEYKENIRYCFGKVVGNDEYTFIKLDGVDILIPIGEEESFMDKYSNWVFTSAADVGLEWYEADYNQANVLTPFHDYDILKYAGKCKLTF